VAFFGVKPEGGVLLRKALDGAALRLESGDLLRRPVGVPAGHLVREKGGGGERWRSQREGNPRKKRGHKNAAASGGSGDRIAGAEMAQQGRVWRFQSEKPITLA